jgi:two-component system, sensor histidine kinase PdtaS
LDPANCRDFSPYSDLSNMPVSALDASTLDHLLEGFQIIGFDWKYRYLNDAAVKQSKYTRGQLIGRTMMECFPGIEHTDMFKALQQSMRERTHAYTESHFIYPDGSEAWFELRIHSIPDGIFVLSIDVSERKKAELELVRLNEKLEGLVKERTSQLEAKNKELMDSLSYAQDIQKAFLNTRSEIEQSF